MSFPEARFVHTNGIRMAVYEEGAGPPVVFCHGFPELAFSWRRQLPAVAAAGFRAIAPDQRGYGASDRPEGVAAYDMHALCADMAGLLDALGFDKAVFCGHDWGGFVVWQMPLLHPGRVAGVIGVNTPFRPRPPVDPITLLRRMFGDDMYIVRFQEPRLADALFAEDVGRTMRFFMRRAGDVAADKRWARELKGLALLRLFGLPEEQWPGRVLLSDEELGHYVAAFENTGFTGALNWYRNFTRNWELAEGLEPHVAVPCLMICAENDVVLRPEYADGMEEYCPDLEKHLIPDCGHWTQQEKPDELNRIIVDWLRRRFS